MVGNRRGRPDTFVLVSGTVRGTQNPTESALMALRIRRLGVRVPPGALFDLTGSAELRQFAEQQELESDVDLGYLSR
jgi:hypothetical protein